MPQTQRLIYSYFPSRKRSVSECIPSPGESNAKKLVALDDGSSSPVRSPVRARHMRAARNERLGSWESIRETHLQTAERIAPTPPVAEKDSKDKPTVFDDELEKSIRNNKKYPALGAAVKKLSKTIDHLNMMKEVLDTMPESIPRPNVHNKAPVLVTDFLDKVKKLVTCNKRINKENTKSQSAAQSGPPPSADPIPALKRALKGVPELLFEKLQAKKAAAKVVESTTQAKEQIMLSRLPELAKIMRLVFVKEGKKVLPESLVVPKVRYSFKEKLSTDLLVEHLKLISSKCPGWMSFFTVHNLKHIRLEKDADISRVAGKLKTLAQAV